MINYYHCPCGHKWTDAWECAVNDTCTECGTKEIEPYYSIEGDQQYSAIIEIQGDVEHTITLIKNSELEAESIRKFFSDLLPQYGFRPMSEDDNTATYWDEFIEWKDFITEGYYSDNEEDVPLPNSKWMECDEHKLDWDDNYVKWTDVDKILP